MQSPQQQTAEQIPATADATLAYVVESVVPEAAVPSAAPTPVDALRQRRSSCLSAFASRPSWRASSAHWRAQQITDGPAPELAVEIAEEQAAPNLSATFAAPHLMQETGERVQPTPQETAQNHTLREETGAVDKVVPKSSASTGLRPCKKPLKAVNVLLRDVQEKFLDHLHVRDQGSSC